MENTTFTWKSSEGREFDVEPVYDLDAWTGREMRTIERLHGGTFQTGWFAMRSAVFAVAIARAVPGYTIQSADAELTYGRVRAIWDEITTKEAAEREAAAEAAAAEAAEAPAEDVVMSPTKLDEPDGTPDPQ